MNPLNNNHYFDELKEAMEIHKLTELMQSEEFLDLYDRFKMSNQTQFKAGDILESVKSDPSYGYPVGSRYLLRYQTPIRTGTILNLQSLDDLSQVIGGVSLCSTNCTFKKVGTLRKGVKLAVFDGGQFNWETYLQRWLDMQTQVYYLHRWIEPFCKNDLRELTDRVHMVSLPEHPDHPVRHFHISAKKVYLLPPNIEEDMSLSQIKKQEALRPVDGMFIDFD